jgi:hypothetical protein
MVSTKWVLCVLRRSKRASPGNSLKRNVPFGGLALRLELGSFCLQPRDGFLQVGFVLDNGLGLSGFNLAIEVQSAGSFCELRGEGDPADAWQGIEDRHVTLFLSLSGVLTPFTPTTGSASFSHSRSSWRSLGRRHELPQSEHPVGAEVVGELDHPGIVAPELVPQAVGI